MARLARAVEAMMKGYQGSDLAKKFVAQGRTQGFNAEDFLEFYQAFTEGRIEGASGAVLTVLRARGIAVPDASRERILAEKDPERLDRWLEKAAVAASVTAVIDESN